MTKSLIYTSSLCFVTLDKKGPSAQRRCVFIRAPIKLSNQYSRKLVRQVLFVEQTPNSQTEGLRQSSEGLLSKSEFIKPRKKSALE